MCQRISYTNSVRINGTCGDTSPTRIYGGAGDDYFIVPQKNGTGEAIANPISVCAGELLSELD